MTDLQIENPTTRVVEADLFFLRAGESTPYQVRAVLAPQETRTYFDVVSNRFGLNNAVGALRLDILDGTSQLRMSSRTYTRVGEGTFGQAVSGVAEAETGEAVYITGLARTEYLRSSVGAVNVSRGTEQFEVLLYDANGALRGRSSVLVLGPSSQMQRSLADLFPDVEGAGLTAEFRPVGGSMSPVGYATVVDNLSGDPTYYAAARPRTQLYLPAVARVSGLGDTHFATDVSLSNPNDQPISVTVTFLERERDNTSGSPSATFVLEPHATRQMNDALEALFGVSETYGALRIDATGGRGVLVSGRIFTSSQTTDGTVGQQVDPVSSDRLMSAGSILGLRHDSAFRSNVGLLNTGDIPVTVNLAVRSGQDLIASGTVTVPAQSYLQRNLSAVFPGASFPAGRTLSLAVDAGLAQIFPFATIVDNVSQDPTFSPGLR